MVIAHRVNSELADIAVRASEAIGAEICGVDIIESSEGPVIIEVNIALGMKIAKVTGIDVPKKIAHYVSERGMEGKRTRKLTYFFERELAKIPQVFKDIVGGKDLDS